MKEEFDRLSARVSKITTKHYSTSFSFGIKFLGREIRQPIYDIYGYVRFADEIVDSFHNYPQEELLSRFREDTFEAIKDGISLNPILHRFQDAVNRYDIDHDLIEAFLHSMKMDLSKCSHDRMSYDEYIFGSAEVVGLMCLKVFTHENNSKAEELIPYAKKLGSAFQKVNFLRDVQADYMGLGRTYFPNVDISNLTATDKEEIEREIRSEFDEALIGIKRLPTSAKYGVYLAYVYYNKLFKKIQRTNSEELLKRRIRIPNTRKLWLMFNTYLIRKLDLI